MTLINNHQKGKAASIAEIIPLLGSVGSPGKAPIRLVFPELSDGCRNHVGILAQCPIVGPYHEPRHLLTRKLLKT